ncbi:MAG TPA: hypothetical protein VH110_01745 [Candidatus Acidoferrum sp.]|jgi:hypothetical protein|nr:hypothetical protein [Candidatus Acidoferrum sp.]
MLVMVAEKRAGSRLVVVGQNTSAIRGVPPELQDIYTPMVIPGARRAPQ